MIRLIAIAFALAIAATSVAAAPPLAFTASGDITPNANGTASFEFRLNNGDPDVTVTAYTITVTFYDREVHAGKEIAEYHWSFVSPVAPKSQRLEYGILDAPAVADLKRRHTAPPGTDPLATAIYTYTATIDAQSAVLRE